MRKVSPSLSLFATVNVALLFSLACTGADNSSGPPQSNFGVAPGQNTTGGATSVSPVGQPVNPVSPVTTPTPTSPVAPVTTVAPTSSQPAQTSTETAPQTSTTATPTSTAANTSATNPPETSTAQQTSKAPETSVGNPDGDPGIPIDDDGYFPSNSNVMGFQGAWYCFEDDVNGSSCEQDVAPWDAETSAMCISGETTERVEADDYSAWGAGIGASLNDQGGTQKAFDAEAKNIKGFKFTITGELDGATLQFIIPLTNKDSEDGPPEYNITKAGTYSVEFEDVVRPEYTGSDDAADPSKLYALKWQIKGGDTDSTYNFCITNVEPL